MWYSKGIMREKKMKKRACTFLIFETPTFCKWKFPLYNIISKYTRKILHLQEASYIYLKPLATTQGLLGIVGLRYHLSFRRHY
jgi:hypothetical protein